MVSLFLSHCIQPDRVHVSKLHELFANSEGIGDVSLSAELNLPHTPTDSQSGVLMIHYISALVAAPRVCACLAKLVITYMGISPSFSTFCTHPWISHFS